MVYKRSRFKRSFGQSFVHFGLLSLHVTFAVLINGKALIREGISVITHVNNKRRFKSMIAQILR